MGPRAERSDILRNDAGAKQSDSDRSESDDEVCPNGKESKRYVLIPFHSDILLHQCQLLEVCLCVCGFLAPD